MPSPTAAPSALRIARVRHLVATGQAHQIRLDARLSRPELAASVGVTDQSIMAWELGRRVPSGPHALVYLDLLDALAAMVADTERSAA